MSKPIRIGLSGPARCGKDYAASHLINLYGGRILKFADPLYELMYLIQDYVGLPHTKDRRLLQILGTDWGRVTDPAMWLKMFERKLSEVADDVPLFVTDVRFPAEADLLKDHGFFLVRIDRANLPNADAPWRQHESERALDGYAGWDLTMPNCPDGEPFLQSITNVVMDYCGSIPPAPPRVSTYIITPP